MGPRLPDFYINLRRVVSFEFREIPLDSNWSIGWVCLGTGPDDVKNIVNAFEIRTSTPQIPSPKPVTTENAL
jgi:hypothetical protein